MKRVTQIALLLALLIVAYPALRTPSSSTSTVTEGAFIAVGIWDIAIDSAGNLFLTDGDNHLIRKFDTAGTMTKVAGSGDVGSPNAGFSGDGGIATDAQLNEPYGVAVDSGGNLFIADTGNGRIRKVDTTGIITTVAGNGSSGFSGDGGAATAAQLRFPLRVAVDNTGNLFIADSGNNRIRKVDATGIITTVAGTGIQGFSGDGGRATSAQLARPEGIAIDNAGNLFIADSDNHRVRKVDTSGIITTVAGTGEVHLGQGGFSGDGGRATSARLNRPGGIAVDSTSNLFIADSDNHRIRKVDTAGIITTVVGSDGVSIAGDGGIVPADGPSSPYDVVVNSAGRLLIAEQLTSRIRKVVFLDD